MRPTLVAKKGFDESKVKRHGKGSERGGQFAPKQGADATQAPAQRPKGILERVGQSGRAAADVALAYEEERGGRDVWREDPETYDLNQLQVTSTIGHSLPETLDEFETTVTDAQEQWDAATTGEGRLEATRTMHRAISSARYNLGLVNQTIRGGADFLGGDEELTEAYADIEELIDSLDEREDVLSNVYRTMRDPELAILKEPPPAYRIDTETLHEFRKEIPTLSDEELDELADPFGIAEMALTEWDDDAYFRSKNAWIVATEEKQRRIFDQMEVSLDEMDAGADQELVNILKHGNEANPHYEEALGVLGIGPEDVTGKVTEASGNIKEETQVELTGRIMERAKEDEELRAWIDEASTSYTEMAQRHEEEGLSPEKRKEELAAHVKEHHFVDAPQTLVEEAVENGDYRTLPVAMFNRSYLASWADSSGDSNDQSLAFQGIVAQEFYDGEFDVDEWLDTRAYDIYPDEVQKRMSGRDAPYMRALAHSMYDETQELLEEAGVDEVVVFRGMEWRSDRVTPDWAMEAPGVPFVEWFGGIRAAGFEDQEHLYRPVADATAELNPMSSWSASKDMAESFAGEKRQRGGGHAVVVGARIPRERIFATPRSGMGALAEAEFITLGPEQDVTVEWRYTTEVL